MNPRTFLVLNTALAFYNVGTIWAHEVDIFRSWKLLDPATFHHVQATHWRKLPYWVFVPVALSLVGSVALFWCHPAASPLWIIWIAFGTQFTSHILTALFWGRLQARLSRDERGAASPYLARFLSTHWIRTLLISAYGFILLAWTIRVLS
jgi:hypothetical protein